VKMLLLLRAKRKEGAREKRGEKKKLVVVKMGIRATIRALALLLYARCGPSEGQIGS